MTTRTRSGWRDEWHAARAQVAPYITTRGGRKTVSNHPAVVGASKRLDALELEGLEMGWLSLDALTCTPKEAEA